MGHAVTLDLREGLDIAARGVHAIFPADHDDAHVRIRAEAFYESGYLTAPTIGNDIQWWPVEPEEADFPFWVNFVVHAVEISQNGRAAFSVIFAHQASFIVACSAYCAMFCVSTCAETFLIAGLFQPSA